MTEPLHMRRPSGGRRLIFYRAGSAESPIGDFALSAIAALRSHADRIIVQLPAEPDDEISRLLGEAKRVISSQPMGVREVGRVVDELETEGVIFDEVVMTDDSWFGPVSPMGPVLARMDAEPVDAWTMTPRTAPGASAWTAVRRREGSPSSWEKALPPALAALGSEESVDKSDVVVGEAFPSSDYAREDPVVTDSAKLLRDGCPLVARRALQSSPLVLERHAALGGRLLAHIAMRGYPVDEVLRSLAKTTAPDALHAAIGLLEITGDVAASVAEPPPIVVLAHVDAGADPKELLFRLSLVPGAVDVVATTTEGHRVDALASALSEARRGRTGEIDVRLVPRDADPVAAVFVGSRDILLAGKHELVLRIQAGGACARTANARRYLARHTWENLLGDEGHVMHIASMFREEGLGLVFPARPHIGLATFGVGWGDLRADASRLTELLRIGVPLGASPLMPIGGMWMARARALRLIAEHSWSWEDYRSGHQWSRLGRAQEAILTAAAGALGFHARTVLTAEHAAVSHPPLEYKIDQLASTTPGFPVDQVALLRRLGHVGAGGATDFLRMHVRANHTRALRWSSWLARWAAGDGPRSVCPADEGSER